jgi:murein DD-endopeptidase MepM/ murein hydrolase activator NlpD
MKKILTIILLLPLMTGCYARHGGFPWFGSDNYGANKVEVKRGDTLYSISKKYDVSMLDLIEENDLSEPYTLNVGQILRLPGNSTYIVAKGDTLYGIARKNHVDVKTLAQINNIKAPYIVKVGQELALPDGLSGHQSASKAYASNTSSKPVAPTTTNKGNNTKVATSNKQATQSSTVKTVSAYRKNKFIWPVNGSVVSNFGWAGKGRRNDGINIKAALGTNVKAADKGVVAYAGNELKGFGNLVLIKHADGYITAYAHNAKLYVKKGQKVLRGEKIATVGTTGSVNTPQLHFEVRAGKKAVNPRAYLP